MSTRSVPVSDKWMAMSPEERLAELRERRVADKSKLSDEDRISSERMLEEARDNLRASKKLPAN